MKIQKQLYAQEQTGDESRQLHRSLKGAAIDASGILLIPPVATLVDMLQDKGILHALWRWP